VVLLSVDQGRQTETPEGRVDHSLLFAIAGGLTRIEGLTGLDFGPGPRTPFVLFWDSAFTFNKHPPAPQTPQRMSVLITFSHHPPKTEPSVRTGPSAPAPAPTPAVYAVYVGLEQR
jgi:hypothetical protein